jgi:hypothetical protein
MKFALEILGTKETIGRRSDMAASTTRGVVTTLAKRSV